MVSHIALSPCLILCWCLWLVRLHVISALFFMQTQQHFISLYFGQSLLMLMTISVFCVCQCVYASVSSFVKKTTEKINTLQMNSDLWPRPDLREGVQGEVTATVTSLPEEVEHEWAGCIFYWCFVYCFYCGFWLSLCKIGRRAVQLGVWAAGAEGRHKESYVSLEERWFVPLHTGRKMFSQAIECLHMIH